MNGKPRLALIGIGRMGSGHLAYLSLSRKLTLCAICDIDPAVSERKSRRKNVPGYTDYREMMDREKPDGVIIATPHYDHTPIAIEAFKRGIHVLTEKPVGVHAGDVRKMIEAHREAEEKYGRLVFAAMFQKRTEPHWIKVKKMIESGRLGSLLRATWIITDWYRSQAYYDQGGWRATWKGEGGGVLMNQAVHNLDLYQWLFGMPAQVTGFSSIGKYHHIEVEDEVTGYFEHGSGLVGHFVTSTAEYPGTDRLEIVGEKGTLVVEKYKVVFKENNQSVLDHSKETLKADGTPRWKKRRIFTRPKWALHETVLANFVHTISGRAQLVAPAEEGLNSILLANGLMYSSFNRETVQFPMDEAAYEKKLKSLIEESTFQKRKRNIQADLKWSKGREV